MDNTSQNEITISEEMVHEELALLVEKAKIALNNGDEKEFVEHRLQITYLHNLLEGILCFGFSRPWLTEFLEITRSLMPLGKSNRAVTSPEYWPGFLLAEITLMWKKRERGAV